MNTRKKTFVKSVFAQLPTESNNNSTASASPKETPKTKKSIRKKPSETPQQIPEVVNLDSDEEKQQTNTNTNTDKQIHLVTNENWIDVFAPTKNEELAVHPKKIQELVQWFKHCSAMKKKRQPAQLCLLTGPSGCGKTAAVCVLAKEMQFSIQEWTNPVDQEVVYNLGDQVYGESNFRSSQVDAFKGFLFKASRYRSLMDMSGSDKRFLMIEDFPNFLLRDSSSFENILDEYLIYGKAPLIFIVTDTKRRGLNISYNLFSDQLKQKFLITHISFNPVAATLMQNAMKRFCTLMRLPPYNEMYRPPTTELMDSIILSAQGDIRNSLINLHFSSLKGAPSLLTKPLEYSESSQETKKTSRKRKCQSTLKSVGRDETVTMMHALGRIFNPKYTDSNKLLHSPEDIAQAFLTEPKKFIDFVHTNYLHHFRDIESVVDAANGLSLSDLILNEYRDDALALTGLNLGIRTVMVANKSPVTGWMPVKGPKRLNLDSGKIPPKATKVLPVHHNISKNQYAIEYQTFVNILATSTD